MKNKTAEKDLSQRHSGRLREIIAILARNQIHKGISPKKVRAILEDLGPTFVKLGSDYVHANGYVSSRLL